jgi:hypothetical protein
MKRYAIEYLDFTGAVVHREMCDAAYALDAASIAMSGLKDAEEEFGAEDFRVHDPETDTYYPSNLHGR